MVEEQEPKFARWMRKHGKLAVLKDDEVDRLERAAAAPSGATRQVGSAVAVMCSEHRGSKAANDACCRGRKAGNNFNIQQGNQAIRRLSTPTPATAPSAFAMGTRHSPAPHCPSL